MSKNKKQRRVVQPVSVAAATGAPDSESEAPMSKPPVCDCGERALARFVDVDEPRFLCEECVVRAVRVTRAKGQLLDVQVHVPAHQVEVHELDSAPTDPG